MTCDYCEQRQAVYVLLYTLRRLRKGDQAERLGYLCRECLLNATRYLTLWHIVAPMERKER